jgi:poly-gamma-glutamate capsule biosynthesis protein CapA/YwtB (metallophosphatase superfamily)
MLATAAILLAAPSWTLLAGGDIMLNGISPASRPLAGIAGPVRAADVAIANLEIPLTSSTEKTARKTDAELKRKDQFILWADPKHADSLSGIGLDLVSLGNNHAMDRGHGGLMEMLWLLEKRRIGYTGAGTDSASAMQPASFKLSNGLSVSMVSALAFVTRNALLKCSPATGTTSGINVLNFNGKIDDSARSKIQSIVNQARFQGDFVAVALHWGEEKQTLPNSYQVSLGRAFVDAGADLVIGHHPHVLQGAERYRDVPILYSTGNLISVKPGNTALFKLTFDGRKLTQFGIVPCRIDKGKVVPMQETDAAKMRVEFGQLSMALSKKYPSPMSKPLF